MTLVQDLSTASPLLPTPPTPCGRSDTPIAVFADLDGTLASIEAVPSSVTPRQARTRLLLNLSQALDGRLAVISGRGLADVDRILEGSVMAVAAVHGLVRRSASGEVAAAGGAERVPEAVAAFRALAEADAGLLVEDKGASAALHYRGSPGAAKACADLADQLSRSLGLRVQPGDQVVELRAPGPDKGDAVRTFMSEPPFAGSTPLFIGDDLTDEAGFAAVRGLGGWGVIVGPRRPTAAQYALSNVDAAFAWLMALAKAQAQ